jgi:hypothetical protein
MAVLKPGVRRNPFAARPSITHVVEIGASLSMVFGGCYSPDLRDCTVTCAGTAECASGQVCGNDHFCAAPARAGSCAAPPVPDAGIDARGHRPPPPDAAPDAPPDAHGDTVQLAIHIDGQGLVKLENGGSCGNADLTPDTECTLVAPRGLPATLNAIGLDNQVFDRWTTPTCAFQGATCVLVPWFDSDVGARFRHDTD